MTAPLTIVGQSVPRIDALPKVTGHTRYLDDLRQPGMLYAKAVTSAFPHARLLAVRTGAAKRIVGVRAVLTAADVPFNRHGMLLLDQPVLADGKVRHRGDAVALVAAVDADTAEEAAERVEVDYDELPAVFDPEEALRPDVVAIHEGGNLVPFNNAGRYLVERGDVGGALKSADIVVTNRYRTQPTKHVPIEPHSALAAVDPAGRVTVWSQTAMPFGRAADVARILRLPQSKVRFIVPPQGGGFGGKNNLFAEGFVALLARATGRPVKYTWSRQEEFLCSTVRHPYIIDHTLAARRDGTLVALRSRSLADAGPYCTQSSYVLAAHCFFMPGPYFIPALSIEGRLAYTNNQIAGAIRGYGAAQANFATEAQVDLVARELGLDLLEVRLRNVIRAGQPLVTGQPCEWDSGRTVLEALRVAWKAAGR